jgi:hypothetical protein
MDMRKLLNLMESVMSEDSFDIEKYANNSGEGSTYKGIPIEFRDHPDVLDKIKHERLRVRYRGPSTDKYKRPASHIDREHATSFALYPKEGWVNDPDYRDRYKTYLYNVIHNRGSSEAIKQKAQELLNYIEKHYS